MANKSTALSSSSRVVPSATPDQQPRLESTGGWILGGAAFAVEIALAVGAAMIGYRLAAARVSVFWAIIAAVIALAGLVTVWATWMSPGADHRLEALGRAILGAALILLVAAGLISTGARGFGWILGTAGLAVMLIAELAMS